MRSGCLYIYFMFAGLHAGENKVGLSSVREQRIAFLQSRIAEIETEWKDAVECRNDSRDPIDRQEYAKNVVAAYVRIKELQVELNQAQSKP